MNIQQARTLVVGQTVYWKLYSHKCFTVKKIDKHSYPGRTVIAITISDGTSSTLVSCNQLSLEPII